METRWLALMSCSHVAVGVGRPPAIGFRFVCSSHTNRRNEVIPRETEVVDVVADGPQRGPDGKM